MGSQDIRAKMGRIGFWSFEMRFGDKGEVPEAAAEIEELGYGALWLPGGLEGGALADVDRLVAATDRIVIAVGILNIYKEDPAEIAAWWQAQSEQTQGRVLLGLGVSHGPVIGADYTKPLATMSGYLDQLDALGQPRDSLCIAALGPKMLALSRDRSLGSHPYLGPPEHTRAAREVLGPDKLLAPEVGAILETDPAKARDIGRQALATYSRLPNYVNNWLRHGFTREDVDNLSDRLVDRIFAWGDMDRIAARVREHLDAGADHVCVQAIRGASVPDFPASRAAARALAKGLL
ncbi:MAG: LLM class F420-dependent oxidoreductase [Novosphingobium sp.]|nr:LLM class F420-dependent oxidoreductase [Novosphingobium sp.]